MSGGSFVCCRFQIQANDAETAERGAFSILSTAVRDSHEKERARAERTKYWSVIGSVVGAIIGIIGTSLNNRLRMTELQSLVTRSVATNAAPVENLQAEVGGLAKAQQQQLETFVADLKLLLGEQYTASALRGASDTGFTGSREVMSAVKEHQLFLAKEMQGIKEIIAARKGVDLAGGEAIVYVREDLERALDKTEQNMEWKMKINSIVTVSELEYSYKKKIKVTIHPHTSNVLLQAAFMYTAFALTVPLIYYLYGPK